MKYVRFAIAWCIYHGMLLFRKWYMPFLKRCMNVLRYSAQRAANKKQPSHFAANIFVRMNVKSSFKQFTETGAPVLSWPYVVTKLENNGVYARFLAAVIKRFSSELHSIAHIALVSYVSEKHITDDMRPLLDNGLIRGGDLKQAQSAFAVTEGIVHNDVIKFTRTYFPYTEKNGKVKFGKPERSPKTWEFKLSDIPSYRGVMLSQVFNEQGDEE